MVKLVTEFVIEFDFSLYKKKLRLVAVKNRQ